MVGVGLSNYVTHVSGVSPMWWTAVVQLMWWKSVSPGGGVQCLVFRSLCSSHSSAQQAQAEVLPALVAAVARLGQRAPLPCSHLLGPGKLAMGGMAPMQGPCVSCCSGPGRARILLSCGQLGEL